MKNATQTLLLSEDERNFAVMIAKWENMIVQEAVYIMNGEFKHPVNDIRASRHAIDLAKSRKIILELHPNINENVLAEVHSVMDQLAA
jgi:hypothetical protein